MVPKFKEYFAPFMTCISDGRMHKINDINKYCAKTLGLTCDDMLEKTKGGYLQHYDRVKWAAAYLKRIGFAERPRIGVYHITDKGLEIFDQYS